MQLTDKVFVAGHRGMVGSALVRKLGSLGYTNLLTKNRSEIDLTDQAAVLRFFSQERPAHVIIAAAKVGGIFANDTYRVEFLYDNLMIAANLIRAAAESGCERLMFLGSSCIYPKMAPQPIPEKALLTGPLEPTNEPYALAKIMGLKLCESYARQYGRHFFSVMPTNIYGPGDNYHPTQSHVIPGLFRRFHEGKRRNHPFVTVWGTGQPLREFLYVEDLADALVMLLQRDHSPGLINVGTGQDLSIRELAHLIAATVGYRGEIRFDVSRSDGPPRKLLDVSRLKAMGWKPKISLADGLRQTYRAALAAGAFEPSGLDPIGEVLHVVDAEKLDGFEVGHF